MDIRIIAIVLLTFLYGLQVLGYVIERNELEEKRFQAWFDHFTQNYNSNNLQPNPSTNSKHIQRIYKKSKKQTFVPSYPEKFNAPLPIYPFFLNPQYQETIYTDYVPLQYNTATHLIPVPELVYPQEESHHRVIIPFNNPYPILYGHSTVSEGLKPDDYFTSVDTTHIPITNSNIHCPYDINNGDSIELLHTINNNSGENGDEHAENNVHLQILEPVKKPIHVGIESNENFNNYDKQKPVKDLKIIENTPTPDKIEIPLISNINENHEEIGSQVEENHVHPQVVLSSSEKPIPEEFTIKNQENKPITTQDGKIINISQNISPNEEHVQPSNIVEVNIPTPSSTSNKYTLGPNLFGPMQTTQNIHDHLNIGENDKLDVRFPIINIPLSENLVQNSKTTEVPYDLKQNTIQISNVKEKLPETNTNIAEALNKIIKSDFKPETEFSNTDGKYDVGVFLSTISSLPKIQETTTFSSLPSVTTKIIDEKDYLENNRQKANDEDDLSDLSILIPSSTSSSIFPYYQSPQTEDSITESSEFSTLTPSTQATYYFSVPQEFSNVYTFSSTTTDETTSVPTLSSNQYYSTEHYKSAEALQISSLKKEIINNSSSNKNTYESNISSYKDIVQPLENSDDHDDTDDSDDSEESGDSDGQIEQKLSNPTLSPECQSSQNSKNNDNSCYNNEYMIGRSSGHSRLSAKIPKLIIPTKIKPPLHVLPKHILPKIHPKLHHIGRDSEDNEDRDEHNTESPENDEINTAKLYTTVSKQYTPNNHGTPEQIEMLLKKLSKYFKPEYESQILTKQNNLQMLSHPEDKDLVIILPWVLSEPAKNLAQKKQIEIINYNRTE